MAADDLMDGTACVHCETYAVHAPKTGPAWCMGCGLQQPPKEAPRPSQLGALLEFQRWLLESVPISPSERLRLQKRLQEITEMGK